MKTLIIVCFVTMIFIGEFSPQSEWINCRTEIQGMDFLDSIGIRNYEVLVPPRITSGFMYIFYNLITVQVV